MSGFPDDILHDAMLDGAGDAASVIPTADGWDDVRARARRRRSARRRAQTGALLVGSVALIGGLVLLAGGGSRDSARIQVVDSTPQTVPASTPTTAPSEGASLAADEVVAVRADGRIVVLDAADGTEIREVTPTVLIAERRGPPQAPETLDLATDDVAVSLSAERAVVFHDGVALEQCPGALYGRELTSVPVGDGRGATQVGDGRWPAVSPDGRSLAYVRGVDPCDGPGELVVLDLETGEERTWSVPVFDDGGPQGELVGPLGFEPDSCHLLVPINWEPATEWWNIDTDAAPGVMQGELAGGGPLYLGSGESGPYALWQSPTLGIVGAFGDGRVGEVGNEGLRNPVAVGTCPKRITDCRVRDVLWSPDGARTLLLVGGAEFHGIVDAVTGEGIADEVVAADW